MTLCLHTWRTWRKYFSELMFHYVVWMKLLYVDDAVFYLLSERVEEDSSGHKVHPTQRNTMWVSRTSSVCERPIKVKNTLYVCLLNVRHGNGHQTFQIVLFVQSLQTLVLLQQNEGCSSNRLKQYVDDAHVLFTMMLQCGCVKEKNVFSHLRSTP